MKKFPNIISMHSCAPLLGLFLCVLFSPDFGHAQEQKTAVTTTPTKRWVTWKSNWTLIDPQIRRFVLSQYGFMAEP